MNARRNIKLKMLNVYKEKPKFKLKTDIYLRNIWNSYRKKAALFWDWKIDYWFDKI